MKEYLAGPSPSEIDRNNYISVMASARDEAAKKARILNAPTNRGILFIRADGEDSEHEVTPVNHREIERQKKLEQEGNLS
ncbi:MAG: hypothetical protein EBS21_02305 [Sphingomonadaceae bacterium]|nr:hypothetical protein [Sphingomonadaceae bacterium]